MVSSNNNKGIDVINVSKNVDLIKSVIALLIS